MANEQAGQKKQADVEVNTQLKGEEQAVNTGQENLKGWSQLVTQAWADEKLKQRLTHNPAAVLQEHGIEVPAGIEIRVVENTDKICYLTLPARPSGELTPSQLQGVVGGTFWTTVSQAARLEILGSTLPPDPAALAAQQELVSRRAKLAQ